MSLIPGLITVIILIFSAILHEIAHGFVAERLGDPTARLSGRLTLNPKNHIDPVMSILLPLVLIISGSPVIFGAAKPVPVDPFNLKEGRKDLALVALAGPLTNIFIAIIAAIILHGMTFLAPATGSFLNASPQYIVLAIIESILLITVQINLLLAIFNLIPIPPLDGSKVFALILPEKEAAVYMTMGSVGFLIIFFLLLFPIGSLSLGNLVYSLLIFSLKLLGL